MGAAEGLGEYSYFPLQNVLRREANIKAGLKYIILEIKRQGKADSEGEKGDRIHPAGASQEVPGCCFKEGGAGRELGFF